MNFSNKNVISTNEKHFCLKDLPLLKCTAQQYSANVEIKLLGYMENAIRNEEERETEKVIDETRKKRIKTGLFIDGENKKDYIYILIPMLADGT